MNQKKIEDAKMNLCSVMNATEVDDCVVKAINKLILVYDTNIKGKESGETKR